MAGRVGAGASRGLDSATAALEDAASKLRPAAMQRAIRAGADISGSVGGSLADFHYSLPRLALLVIHALTRDDENRKVADTVEQDAQRAAALRVLAENGCFASGDAASATLLDALTLNHGPLVTRCLLDAGASPTFVVDNGIKSTKPLLHTATRAATATILLEAGADAAEVDDEGNTALHNLALGYCVHRSAGLVAVLVAAGAKINARNNLGRTPLGSIARQLYCGESTLCAVDELLAAGADPTIADHAGVSPLLDVRRLVKERIPAFATRPDWDRSCCISRVTLLRRLHGATAWWRRRHLLLAVRGR